MFKESFSKVYEAQIKNLVVDYHDRNMNSLHRAIQVVNISKKSDEFISNVVRVDFKKEGYNVCSIIEIIGDYTFDEFTEIVEDVKYRGKVNTRLLYVDLDKVFV